MWFHKRQRVIHPVIVVRMGLMTSQSRRVGNFPRNSRWETAITVEIAGAEVLAFVVSIVSSDNVSCEERRREEGGEKEEGKRKKEMGKRGAGERRVKEREERKREEKLVVRIVSTNNLFT